MPNWLSRSSLTFFKSCLFSRSSALTSCSNFAMCAINCRFHQEQKYRCLLHSCHWRMAFQPMKMEVVTAYMAISSWEMVQTIEKSREQHHVLKVGNLLSLSKNHLVWKAASSSKFVLWSGMLWIHAVLDSQLSSHLWLSAYNWTSNFCSSWNHISYFFSSFFFRVFGCTSASWMTSDVCPFTLQCKILQ